MTIERKFERYADGVERIKVDGGHIYMIIMQGNISTSFVPEIDLDRYQSHLRDAYSLGYTDGHEDAKNGVVNPHDGLTAYRDKGSD